ncbi:MAG: hypothetical protein ACOY93_02080 [Bacillota bacterium]
MQGFPSVSAQQAGRPNWSGWAATSPSLGNIAPGSAGAYPAGPGTYAGGGLPNGGPPPIAPMPGPTSLGPGAVQGSMGTGVAGVGINPVSAVTPPAASGGPHPLPSIPPAPLPQGFPNPFELQQISPQAADAGQPLSPGTTRVTGPRGYLPGLGHFGTPGQGGQPALPGPLGGRMPQLPQLPQGTPPGGPAAGAQARPQPSPFWLALAWQLVNTDTTRAALGERIRRLMEGSDRMRTLQVATSLLLSPEMQNAFNALSSGALQQAPFAALFAERLRGALDAAGLGRAG